MKLKVKYDQTPHIVRTHPLMTNDAESVFISLYKILKDKEKCIYSNAALSIASRQSLRTLDRSIDLLESLGFITRTGLKQNRRFGRGLLLMYAHDNDAYAKDADVVNNKPAPILNTCVTDADACVTDADACVTDADILRLSTKNLTTNTSSVVFISESQDKLLVSTYLKYPVSSVDIKNSNDMLHYCKWYLDKGKSKGINQDGRFSQVIKYIKEGSLRVDPEWLLSTSRKKTQQSNTIRNEYQDYTSKIKADVNLGILPRDTIILKFDEWTKTYGRM